jgi:aspartyl/asparaginyl beta-hydroxylase (cupin superfamily)
MGAETHPAGTLRAAQDALTRGDAGLALELLSALGDALPAPQGQWLLARACAMTGDRTGERNALSRILEGNRRELAALIAMGRSFAAGGDDRAAVAWFTTALNQAAATPPPDNLVPLLHDARRFCAEAQQRFADQFQSALADLGSTARPSPALSHGLDLLFGRSEIFLQQPTMFYYPGLPQRAFYDPTDFAWTAAFEAQAVAVRDEFLGILSADDSFNPYVRRSATRPASSSPLLEDPSWGAAYLIEGGEHQAISTQAPVTMAALATADQPDIGRRSPMALYSRLKPGTHIAPHHGLLNTRLICHLPLVAPDGCALRVGAETREWRFGKLFIFDDSVEHEAWNRGASDRTVLLFEIWRPEIPEGDRDLLVRIFETIDRVAPDLGKEQA